MSCLTYRQFDYDTHMRYTHRLSRWLHKRLAHNYTQAGFLHPYTIRLSTILRDSGTYQSPRAHNNARQVDEALTELKGGADSAFDSEGHSAWTAQQPCRYHLYSAANDRIY
jgi:hypothetical protein